LGDQRRKPQGGLVEEQQVAAALEQLGQVEPVPLAAGEDPHLFLLVGAAEVEAGRSLLETKTIALDENAPSAKTKEKNAKIEKEEEPEPALTRNAKEEK
jgi:hypothetical protein